MTKSNFNLKVNEVVEGCQLTAVWGRSGSGKSLLLRALAGFEPCAGQIELDGQILQRDENSHLLKAYRRNIMLVPQQPYLFPFLSVEKNLQLALRFGRNKAIFDYDDVVRQLGLVSLLHRSSRVLSGGERQRVSIAQAILNAPKLLLLDEPLSAIDDASKNDILSFLDRVKALQRLPVLYVTHSFDEVLTIADRVMVMDSGQVVHHDTLEGTLANYRLPLISDNQLGGMIKGKVVDVDALTATARIAFSGGEIVINQSLPERHQDVTLIIRARDVSLSLKPLQTSTIVNGLPAVIESIESMRTGWDFVRLRLGGAYLYAIITLNSRERLSLQAGSLVYANFKAVSVVRMASVCTTLPR